MSQTELDQLQESNENGKKWFDSYQEIDLFLFEELEKRSLEFPIIDGNNNPSVNTIEAIKLLINQKPEL